MGPVGSIYREDLSFVHDAGFGGFARAAAPHLLDLLRRRGIESGAVVDLGCGSGIWARELVDAGYEALGIDASAAMVRLARRRAPAARFRPRLALDDAPAPLRRGHRARRVRLLRGTRPRADGPRRALRARRRGAAPRRSLRVRRRRARPGAPDRRAGTGRATAGSSRSTSRRTAPPIASSAESPPSAGSAGATGGPRRSTVCASTARPSWLLAFVTPGSARRSCADTAS